MKKLPKLSEIKIPSIHDIRRWVLDFRRDVIRMMRLKFVAVAMGILIVVFLIMLSSINMIMNTVSESQSMTLLKQIAESERYDNVNDMPFDGMPPQRPDGEIPPEFRDMIPPEEQFQPTEAETVENVNFQFDGGFEPLKFDDREKFQDWGNFEYWGEFEDWQNFGDGQNFEDWRNFDDKEKYDKWKEDFDHFRPPFDDDFDDDDDEIDEPSPPTESPQKLSPEPPPPTEAPQQEPAPVEPVPPEKPAENPPEEAPVSVDVPPAENPPPPTEVVPLPVVEETAPPETEVVSEVTELVTSAVVSSETAPVSSETIAETTEETSPLLETVPPMPNGSDPPPNGVGNGGNNNGYFRPEMRRDRWNMIVNIDHFAILVDEEGNFISLRNTEDYTEDEAVELMQAILAKNKQQGMYEWLQYYVADKSYGKAIVVTDKTSDQGLLNNLFRTTVIVGLIMLLILLVILIVLSKLITDPVEQAFVRQKQFVSDAGHELKTPLAVMTANADILQDEIGENKWLIYMQEQIGRMSQLVGDLLRLARMDNATQQYTFEDFDLSLAVAATALPFESKAFEEHRNLEIDVQPDVRYNGSEQHIRQLCAIFIDNAIKYSNENGKIKVTLLQRGDHQILEFYNTGCEISPSETEKIFERFYRGDKARNNKGKSGYGLGLAIAKSIMDVHKIKIQVTCEQGKWIRFLMTM